MCVRKVEKRGEWTKEYLTQEHKELTAWLRTESGVRPVIATHPVRDLQSSNVDAFTTHIEINDFLKSVGKA